MAWNPIGDNMAKTYKVFLEADVKNWKDIKDRNILKSADKFKKKMKAGNVLGYTQVHGEFVIFRNDKEWEASVKDAKDMKWLRVD
tara:strand:- start:172 stop:426 length:255 start_codon:yes stop_codon:yes gene_type:complete